MSERSYISLFYRAGTLSLGSAALLGWLMALQRTDPGAIRKLGITAPHRITQLHLDQVMMGLILLSTRNAFPDLPNRFAGPSLAGTILNPLGFVPLAFSAKAEKTLAFKAGIGLSFILSTIGFVGTAYWAVTEGRI